MESSRKNHYANFDILRLLLAASVVLKHCLNATGHMHAFLQPAVPAFLAISGFVVLASYERSSSWLHFAWKRCLRVLPAFVCALALSTALFGWAGLSQSLQAWTTFGFIIGDHANAPLWSLSCEEVCYLLLAILYALGAYRDRNVVWLLFAVSLIASTCTAALYGNIDAVFRISPLLPSFFVGNLCYLYRERLQRFNPKIPTIAAAGMAITIFVQTSSPTVDMLHTVVLAFFVVWFGIAGIEIRVKLPGDYSYGAYIYHYPILVFMTGAGMSEAAALTLAVSCATYCIAAISWARIEAKALLRKGEVPRLASWKYSYSGSRSC